MSRKKSKERSTSAREESVKIKGSGPTPPVPLKPQTFDDYLCVGSVETDFTELCNLLGVKNIPPVFTKHPSPPPGEDGETDAQTDEGDPGFDDIMLKATTEVTQMTENTTPALSKPCLYVELESEDPLSARTINISGWKLRDQCAVALIRLLPSLSRLQLLRFWQAGLTDQMVVSLKSTITLCSNLRHVTLDGNPLPNLSYHLLMSVRSPVRFLSLRNNEIGDEGARLIGLALSTPKTANRTLMSLNLAFNRIGDVGATHIAKGLRLNRALCFLSLSNNQIGDIGATELAKILGPFPLTHEEVVRRRVIMDKGGSEPWEDEDEDVVDRSLSAASNSSANKAKAPNKGSAKTKEPPKKEDKAAAKKGSAKPPAKKTSAKAPKKGSKTKDKQPGQEESTWQTEVVRKLRVVNPLLEDTVKHADGQVILTGNGALASLNLAGNRISEQPLPVFVSSLTLQPTGGLLRLCLQRNKFSPYCDSYVKLQVLMKPRDPLQKNVYAQYLLTKLSREKKVPEKQPQITRYLT